MKKLMAMFVAAVMLLSLCPTVFAQEFTQPCVVDYFNSFNGFNKPNKTTADTPQGFVPFLYNKSFARPLTTVTGNGNTYLKLDATAIMMPFDETVRTGKLRISFDAKIEDYNNLYRFYLYGHNNSKNDNVYDLRNAADTDYAYSQLMDCNIRKDGYMTLGAANNDDNRVALDAIGNVWHKYDIVQDFNAGQMVLYIDGVPKATAAYGYGLKSLYFFAEKNTDTGKTSPVYLDNVFVKHYPDGNVNEVRMTADYQSGGVSKTSGVVNVVFSEETGAVNEQMVYSSDFAAVNTVTGRSYDPTGAGIAYGNVQLTFGELPQGKYNIIVNDTAKEAYKGMVTNSLPTDGATFVTEGDLTGTSERNYLINEDFDNYEGGMPAHAVTVYGGKTSSVLTADVGKDGGTAIKIDNTQQLIYEFPEVIMGGKFTYEFDIYHTDGRWATGVLNTENFIDKSIIDDTLYQKTVGAGEGTEPTDEQEQYEWTEKRNKMISVGNAGYGDTAQVVQYAKTKQSWPDGNNISGLACPKDSWQHVAVEVDLDTGAYTVTVNGNTQTVFVNTDRFKPYLHYQKKLVNGELKWVRYWCFGVKGISLGAFSRKTNDAYIKYDNLKVYTDTSYNSYQTFDAPARTDEFYMSGWGVPSHPLPRAAGLSVTNNTKIDGNGRNYNADTNAGDRAIKISDVHTQRAIHYFNKPIKGANPFEIEYDIKYEYGAKYVNGTSGTSIGIGLGLLTENEFYPKFENTYITDMPAEAINKEDKGLETNQNLAITSNLVMDNRNGVLRSANGRTSWEAKDITDTSGKAIPFGNEGENKSGDWYHVKLKGYPDSSDKIVLQAEITPENGDTQVSKEWRTALEAGSDGDIAALYFQPVGSVGYETNIYLDNLVVKEVSPKSKVYATEINAVGIIDGEEAPLSNGMSTMGQQIKINFSAPIKSTAGIKVYKINGEGNANVNYTSALSEDGKSVTVTCSGLTEGVRYVVEVNNTVQPLSDTALTTVEPAVVYFTATAPEEAKITVDDFRLYKYYAAGSNVDVAYLENWVPVAESELCDLDPNDKYRFVASGSNSGTATELWLGKIMKNPESNLLTSVEESKQTANYGKFKLELPEFSFTGDPGNFEVYLWNWQTIKPLHNAIKYSITKTENIETETE